MKNSIALVALLTLGSATLPSQAEISVDFFYDALEPHGDWIEVADYGYAFHPRDVGRDWRPYTDGQWAHTDAGWTWVSEEPFGWATYHYGRWANVESVGWVWVPGTEWGPAWVSWRRSERHVGWAPLPPEARFRANVSIGNWADAYFDIGPANYSFVEVRHLGAPRLRTVILPARENIVFVRETRNITNIIYQNNIVINEGPRYDDVARVSADPIRRLRLERREDIRDVTAATSFRTQVQGETLSVAAPAVNFADNVKPKKVARRVEQARVNRGWTGTSAAPQEIERLRASVKQEAQAPADLPAKPKFEREERSTTATKTPATSTDAADAQKADPNKPTATTPGTPDQKGATTAPDGTPMPRDGRRPGSRAGIREETTGKPDSTVPPEAPTATERPVRGKAPGKTPRDASTPPATPESTKPDATTPDSAKPEMKSETEGRPGRAVRPAGEDGRGRRGAETGKPETPGASTTPGSPDPAATGRPESPGRSNPVKRPETPGRSEQPGRETSTPKPETTAPEPPRKESPSTRPAREERSSERPKAERANRPEAATRSESAEKPEPAKRPEPKASPSREERPQPQAKPDRVSRPQEPAQRAADAGGERMKAARNAAAERPQPKAERPAPKQAEPKAETSATNATSGEEKPRGKKKE